MCVSKVTWVFYGAIVESCGDVNICIMPGIERYLSMNSSRGIFTVYSCFRSVIDSEYFTLNVNLKTSAV